jgi:threonyl-tRNA synthetase
MLVVGQKEQEEGLVSVRSRFKGDEGAQPLDKFISDILVEINTKEIKKIEVVDEKK